MNWAQKTILVINKRLNKLVCADIIQSLKTNDQGRYIFQHSFKWAIEETLSYGRQTLANLPNLANLPKCSPCYMQPITYSPPRFAPLFCKLMNIHFWDMTTTLFQHMYTQHILLGLQLTSLGLQNISLGLQHIAVGLQYRYIARMKSHAEKEL